MTIIDSNLSALKALDKKMQVTADNVANVNTNRFKKSRADLIEGQNSTVRVDIDKVDTPGFPIQEYEDDQWVDSETSNVDLAEELTETIPTSHAYEANLKVVRTSDEILGRLLDIIG
jgi:flagellar hook protein FlgE